MAYVPDSPRVENRGGVRDVERRPFGEMLAATSKNLTLIDRYIRDEVVRRLQTSGDQAHVLKLALNASDYIWRDPSSATLSHPNAEYWEAATDRHREEFHVLLHRYKGQTWAGQLLVRRGYLRLEEFFEEFGVGDSMSRSQ
jgi:hypothetical protein